MTEFIEIRGARENNVRDVSLRIPKRKITIFTGVSGVRQVVGCVRHDRGGNAASALRQLQPVHPELPAPTTHSRIPKPSRTSAWLSRSTRSAWALALDGRTITDLAPQMDCRPTRRTDHLGRPDVACARLVGVAPS
jgi:hypothetical protein